MPKLLKLTVPPVPENSPVPAWRHYAITRAADLEIQKVLTESGQKEFLLGLEVSYVILEEAKDTYAMAFGNTSLEDPVKRTKNETALTDEFLDNLYMEVEQYLRENMASLSDFQTRIVVRTNRVLRSVRIQCLSIGTTFEDKPVKCTAPVKKRCANGSKRKCKEHENAWICNKHQAC
jgi:hypothetical protein